MKIFNQKVDYPWIKDNITLIILIPTVVGGFWQLMELNMIGTAYLRFFSISQMVPDGILTLFFMWLVYVFGWLIIKEHFGFWLKKDKKQKRSDASNGHKQLKGLFVKVNEQSSYKYRDAYTMAVFLVGATWFVYWKAYLPEIVRPLLAGSTISTFQWVGFFCIGAIFIITIKSAVTVILDAHGVKLNWSNKIVDNVKGLFSAFGILFGFFFVLYLLTVFHQSFFLPDDFKNKAYLDCSIRRNNPSIDSVRILYFNDKYIFVQLIDTTKKTKVTEVMPFDNFIKSNACDTSK